MKRFRSYLEALRAVKIGHMDLSKQKVYADHVTPAELKVLEKELDKLFKDAGIDIEFTKHFLQRLNDPRNGQQIKVTELRKIFRSTYKKYKTELAGFGDRFQAVLQDLNSKINVPFVLQWDHKNDEMDLISKTVMRKKDFKTFNRKLKV